MEKWADYLISAARYEESLNSKIISYFKIHCDNGNSVGEGSTWTKQEVLEAMLKGETFLTIHKMNGGKWKRGRAVTISKVDKIYLRSDSENVKEHDRVDVQEF